MTSIAGRLGFRRTRYLASGRTAAGKCWNDGMVCGEMCMVSRTLRRENRYHPQLTNDAINSAVANWGIRFLRLTGCSSVFGVIHHLQATIATAAQGIKRRVVNFVRNARPPTQPRTAVERQPGSSTQHTNIKMQATCMEAAGRSVYASPEKASTTGSVVNSATARTPAASPNNRLVQRNTTAAPKRKNGTMPER